jgi:hypothetical protein
MPTALNFTKKEDFITLEQEESGRRAGGEMSF